MSRSRNIEAALRFVVYRAVEEVVSYGFFLLMSLHGLAHRYLRTDIRRRNRCLRPT